MTVNSILDRVTNKVIKAINKDTAYNTSHKKLYIKANMFQIKNMDKESQLILTTPFIKDISMKDIITAKGNY